MQEQLCVLAQRLVSTTTKKELTIHIITIGGLCAIAEVWEHGGTGSAGGVPHHSSLRESHLLSWTELQPTQGERVVGEMYKHVDDEGIWLFREWQVGGGAVAGNETRKE